MALLKPMSERQYAAAASSGAPVSGMRGQANPNARPARAPSQEQAVTAEWKAGRDAKHAAARSAMLARKQAQATRQAQPAVDAVRAAQLKLSGAGRNY